MANWFYTDANGLKQGPINDKQLVTLAAKGIITQETVIETEQGKFAPAGRVKGLTFAETKLPEIVSPVETDVYGLASPAPAMAPPAKPVSTTAPQTHRSSPRPVPPRASVSIADRLKTLPKPIIFGGIAGVFLILLLIGGVWMMSSSSSPRFTAEEQAEIDKFCEELGSDVKAVDKNGHTLLHSAVLEKNVTITKYLISKGAKVNAKSNNGGTPLHTAAVCNNIEVVKYLVFKGADVNAKSNDGHTPLDLAKMRPTGNTAVIEYLSGLKQGKKPSNNGAESKNEIDEFCKKFGTDVKAVDDKGSTLLHKAARSQGVDVLQYLVSNGADIHAVSDLLGTPLHWAASFNQNVDVAKYLVSKGADINAKNKRGGIPLHNAAFSNENVEIIKFFVEKGVDVNVKDNEGNTPLHEAVANNKNFEVIKYLVENGANIHAKEKNGLTPLQCARLGNNTVVAEYLSSAATAKSTLSHSDTEEQRAEGIEDFVKDSVATISLSETYEDTEYDFSFRYPNDWKVSPPAMGARAIIMGQLQGGFAPSISIVLAPPDEDFLKTTSTTLQATYEVFLQKVSIKDFGIRKFADKECVYCNYQGTLAQGQTLEGLQFMFLHKNKTFVVTMSDGQSNFGKNSPVFNSILHSFQFDTQERKVEEKRIAEEKLVEEKRVAEEKLAEEKRVAEEKRIAEEEQKAEALRIADEELEERLKPDLDRAVKLNLELKKSGFSELRDARGRYERLDDFAKYGTDRLKATLEEMRYNAPDAAKDKVKMDIRKVQTRTAEKVFVAEYPYSISVGYREGGEMTIATGFNCSKLEKISFPVPNIVGKIDRSSSGTVKITLSGSKDAMNALENNKDEYHARVWFKNLQSDGNEYSTRTSADILKIEIVSKQNQRTPPRPSSKQQDGSSGN